MLKKYSTCISKDTLVAEICKAIAPVFESVSEINIRTQVLDIAFAQDTRNLLDWSINPGIYILLLYLTFSIASMPSLGNFFQTPLPKPSH